MEFLLFDHAMHVHLFRAEHYWWRGQNRKTLRMGQFPRHVVTSVAGLSAQDISRPLKHSFIHTGHGDTDPHRSWGHADRIDRLVYLLTEVAASVSFIEQ